MTMTKPDFWRISTAYENRVASFASQDGLSPPAIAARIFSQKMFERAYPDYAKLFRGIPAFSIGFLTPNWPILGSFACKPVGLIAFEEEIESDFDPGKSSSYSHMSIAT